MQRRRSSVSLIWLYLTVMILLAVALSVEGQTQSIVNVIVFRSPDSLTLYLPDPAPVNITGLNIEATTAAGVSLRQEIALLPAFRGLPYDNLPSPLCFHIVRERALDAGLPIACQAIATLEERIVDADVFWYDLMANEDRTLLVYLSDVLQLCPANVPRCNLTFPSIQRIISPTTTPVPFGFPGNPVTRNSQWSVITHDFDEITMVLVPTGCFDMGESGELGHQCFESPYWIDQTEVSQGDFIRLGGVKEFSTLFVGDDLPVQSIAWGEARDFCELRGGYLPTEREWEYAARGPDGWAYPWGNNWNGSNLVWAENSKDQPSTVGSILAGASWVGALDMSGNMWEWVSSIYPRDGGYAPTPGGYDMSGARGLRGSSWQDITSDSFYTWHRAWNFPLITYRFYGFRCARSY